MSNVIRVLESMGSNSSAVIGSAEFIKMLDGVEIDPSHRQALLNQDHAALRDLLGGRSIIRCSVFSPDEEEQPIEPDGDVPSDMPDDGLE